MKKTGWFSEEEYDFVKEMMNVGAGNASTALEQILGRQIELVLPAVHIIPPKEAVGILGRPDKLITCTKMSMVGDIRGSLFLVIDNQDREKLIRLAEQSAGLKSKAQDKQLSVIEEISNIIAGVYLTAIHDLCDLNIYHTVPVLAIDMLQSVLDESIAEVSAEVEHLFFVENEFIIPEKTKEKVRVCLLLIPSPTQSVEAFVKALKEAKIKYGMVKKK